ncbi:MAG: c-type cytochrome [Bacteroidetes bacterium]|nr:c-type cytochrome [Fibrella sp.]
MKSVFKILGIVLAGAIILIVAGGAYVKLVLPNADPAPIMTVRADAAQIERGKYLAYNVAVCMDCHSTRDFTRRNSPMVAGTDGKGGEGFLREHGFPGNYYAPNLTPTHLGSWTDGELYRAITTGVSQDGHALFPVMPYKNYGQMDPQDINAIIAYLRTLAPIDNEVPASEADFPMSFIINTIPAKAPGGQRPDPADRVAYGRYLTTFASCAECHTKMDAQGQPIAALAFAGGNEYPAPTGVARSCNITPAKSGIGAWTKEAFIARFKQCSDPATSPALASDEVNTVMPWTFYANMSEQDLGAIYDYLRTVKPVENQIERYTPKARAVASR